MKRSSGWLWMCGVHGVASMLLWWAGDTVNNEMIWRAQEWTQRPWTLWTSAWVHPTTPQLIVNQIALGAMAALAWVIRPPWTCTLTWLLAWPLTQVSLLWWPQVGYAVGLSGPLHAGTMVLAVQLLGQVGEGKTMAKARRWGALVALGLGAKLLLEQGWSTPVSWDSANSISVVRAAHLSGALWGLLLGAAACVIARRR